MRRYRPFMLLGLAAIIAFSTSSLAYRVLKQNQLQSDQLDSASRADEQRVRPNLRSREYGVASDIRYFQHHEDGPCYAMSWGDDYYRGGPVLSWLPCRKVPKGATVSIVGEVRQSIAIE